MPAVLPPGMTEARFSAALQAVAALIGQESVFVTDEDLIPYHDAYGFTGLTAHRPGAAVAPGSVEELQAVLRVANEHRLPLWPLSRGKNYGYGGAAPCLSGTVALDLGRLRRIIDIDVARGVALLEPGVGFFDLYQHLEREKIPLWASVPGNSLGSVIGNALEYGLGYGPLGDRANSLVGLEVVLPNGELVRTGMGAMANSRCWNLFRYSYGPSWDQLFMQSNFGVVTKAGVWLYPEPEEVLSLDMELPDENDIGWVVETLAPLRLRGVVQGPVNIGNFMRIVMGSGRRAEFAADKHAIADSRHAEVMKAFGLGWWGLHLTFYGEPDLNRARAKVVQDAFAQRTTQRFKTEVWRRGEPRPPSPTHGVPISFPLRIANWLAANGGHLGFSPVLPPDRAAIEEQVSRSRELFRRHDFDFYGGVTLGDRHVNVVNMLAYDRDDADMARRADVLFRELVADARRRGYGEYRSHLSYMDDVASTYDFNNGSLHRLNEWMKDAIDPNGILAPGKQGIWPRRYREGRR
jgi:4-cresol dehydrogenase (hydroxylating) flavoprotein subunit